MAKGEGYMDTNEIMKMKNTDIKTIDKSQLVDIDTIKINPKDPPEKKIQEYRTGEKSVLFFM